ncbi:putative U4/U6 small nuclear ribonucleoprotein PRP31 [Paratrimastix pyriformis]|uniref:U4/U6 small nuclear ribonucleoprotein PRP31 n=1 Tax=Paratrimastix pyriformis TaxID=342808 RepID=A0ABQ8U081_9EUKA|nr:putative U4/U6 small nuclear ribonucleoprotein PRP31 [Paratrimastix pyriformis]
MEAADAGAKTYWEDDIAELAGGDDSEESGAEETGPVEEPVKKEEGAVLEEEEEEDDIEKKALGVAPTEEQSSGSVLRSDRLLALLQVVNEKVRTGRPANMTPADIEEEYQLIVRSNKMLIEIDDDLNEIHKLAKEIYGKEFLCVRAKEIYGKKFHELESIVIAPVEYVRVVKAIGNATDIGQVNLQGLVPGQTLISIMVRMPPMPLTAITPNMHHAAITPNMHHHHQYAPHADITPITPCGYHPHYTMRISPPLHHADITPITPCGYHPHYTMRISPPLQGIPPVGIITCGYHPLWISPPVDITTTHAAITPADITTCGYHPLPPLRISPSVDINPSPLRIAITPLYTQPTCGYHPIPLRISPQQSCFYHTPAAISPLRLSHPCGYLNSCGHTLPWWLDGRCDQHRQGAPDGCLCRAAPPL